MQLSKSANVRLRGSVYYFRYIVPRKLCNRLHKVEAFPAVWQISFSLKTENKTLAYRLAGSLSLFTDKLLLESLQMDAPLRERIDELVKNHFERLLLEAGQNVEYVQMRQQPKFIAQNGPFDPFEVEHEIEQDIDGFRGLAKTGVFPTELMAIADQLLAWKDVPIVKGDALYQYLCRMIVRARIEAASIKLNAVKGDYFKTEISDAFFHGCRNFIHLDEYPYYLENKDTPYHESGQIEQAASLGHFVGLFHEHRKREASVAITTLDEERQILGNSLAVIGLDKPLKAITRDDTRNLYEMIRLYPKNFNKLFPGKNVMEVMRGDKRYDVISPVRQKMYWQTAHKFFNWCVAHGWLDSTPMIATQIKAKKVKSEEAKKGVPFDNDDLLRFFSLPLFTGFAPTDKRNGNRTKPGVVVIKDAFYWLPYVAIYTGARLGELMQLTLTDLRKDGEVAYIQISDEGDKKTKNVSSVRKIPLHPELVRLGFPEYVAAIQDGSPTSKRIFSQIIAPPDRPHREASKWFQRFFDGAGVKGWNAKYRFHSFRHNFEDAARATGMPDSMRYYLQGRAERGSASQYGRGYEPVTTLPYLSQITYPIISHHTARIANNA